MIVAERPQLPSVTERSQPLSGCSLPASRIRRRMPGYAGPKSICRRSPVEADTLFVDKRSPAVVHHHSAIDDHSRNVAALPGVHQRSNRIECRRQMRAAEVEQHDVGLLARRQAAEILLASK